jgi:hypothetical protein
VQQCPRPSSASMGTMRAGGTAQKRDLAPEKWTPRSL